jgi:alpha-glucosidase (family GH31 glycosyl hydrolase)
MSGVPYWGTDIGGFFHTVPETAELYVRWFQFAAFCPVFRSHGRGVGLRGWREHLPWAHGPEIEDICRAFATLRYQLMPYTYSLAWQAHRDGTPLMRPLLLEAPDDPMVVDMAAEYLWGPSLLVAPVTRGGARRWPVYLPRGRWYDYWTQTDYAGEQWIEVDAPLERMPLLVRGGAIIPLGPSRQYLANTAETLSLLIYPDESSSSSFTLYEDDGTSRAYEDGAYALTQIECSSSTERTRLTVDAARGDYAGKPTTRSLRCQVYCPQPPAEVRVSGRDTLRRLPSAAELEATDGWWHDGRHFVWLRLERADEPLEVELRR